MIESKCTIESEYIHAYEWLDENKGWGKGKTIGYFKVKPTDFEFYDRFSRYVLTEEMTKQISNNKMGFGWDFIDRNWIEEKIKKIQEQKELLDQELGILLKL